MKQEKEQSNAYQKLIRLACQSGANVLISGATGTGKTRLAKQIHDGSTRKTAPFVTVNLATLHEGVLESELFGHERGSFTGAEQRRTGKLEMAQGGTVFLDEIGELPLRLQARLLEFLQSKTITPVGSNREVRLDVRVIVATHRDLERAVQKSEFREDLFHRLRVISISLECLRNRSDDFDAILQTNLHDLCISAKKPAMRLNSEVMTRYKRAQECSGICGSC
jgi:DNA-binding NtrC family response regulator